MKRAQEKAQETDTGTETTCSHTQEPQKNPELETMMYMPSACGIKYEWLNKNERDTILNGETEKKSPDMTLRDRDSPKMLSS